MSDAATLPRSSAEITATIQALHTDLNQVRSVEAIMPDAAAIKIKDILADIASAQDVLTEAFANEFLEARNKLVASFYDISITTSRLLYDNNLSCARFAIKYTRLAYDMSARASAPTEYSCQGFDALPDEAYDYLIEVRPEVIPPEIMQLAPGKPREAFARYFTAQRRGYYAG